MVRLQVACSTMSLERTTLVRLSNGVDSLWRVGRCQPLPSQSSQLRTLARAPSHTTGISLLLYEPYANVSSQICPFLAWRPQFHSNHRVNLSTPRYCQSATFGRLTFCVYPLFFTEFAFNVATPTARTPCPPRKPLCGKIGLHAEL